MAGELPVVILCGGRGTRLVGETETRPKPMVEVGGRPLLWHVMKIYERAGFRDFVLCLGYKGEVIKEYFLSYRARHRDVRVRTASGEAEFLGPEPEDWTVLLAETGLDVRTGGRLIAVRKYLAGTFCMTYGDGVADVDVRAILKTHRRAGRAATVTAVHPPSRFGEIEVESERVRSFVEKPQTGTGWINGGFMVLEPRALEFVEGDEMFEEGPMRRLAEAGELAVYRHDGFWRCVDTPRDLDALNALAREGAPWLR